MKNLKRNNITSLETDKCVGCGSCYPIYIKTVLSELLKDEKNEIYLIPHVITEENYNNVENDLKVCNLLKSEFPSVNVVEKDFNPAQVKNIISQMDFFIGARMHLTIAAFSMKVPVIPFAYSKKFEGLYSALGYNYVIDGRCLETDEAVRKSMFFIQNRNQMIADLYKSYERMLISLESFNSIIRKEIFSKGETSDEDRC